MKKLVPLLLLALLSFAGQARATLNGSCDFVLLGNSTKAAFAACDEELADVITKLVGGSAADTSAELRALISDEVGTGALMFGLDPAMADGLSCTGSQVVRRNAGDTAFECATVSGGGTPGGSSGQIQYNNAGAFGGFTMGGDLSVDTSTGTATIATNAVSDAKLRQGAATSVIGRSANSTGNVADIAATVDDRVLSRASGALGWTTVSGSMITTSTVANSRLSTMAASTFKGRITASTGNPEDMTGTQATTLLDAFTSALKGLAPASGGGTTNFLRADGTWAAPPDDDIPESGDFTNLAATSPITQSSGTISTSISTNRLVGRTTAGSGVMEQLTPDATLSLSAGNVGVVDVTCTGCLGATEVASLDAGDTTTGTFGDARVDGSLEADEVNPTLGTQTQGNFQTGNTAGTGIAITQTPAEGFSSTVAFDYSDAGSSPALAADECRFTSNATVGGAIVCEGDVADTEESRIAITAPTADRTFTIPNADSNPVQPLTCGGTDKVSAISSTGVITCSTDSGGAGSGDNLRVEDGDNAGTFTAMVDADFDDSGDINFARAAGPPDVLTATVRADSVALGTDTTNNYVATVADGTGIDGTASGEGTTYTPTLDLTEISSATLGVNNFTTLTLDSGAGSADATLTAGSSGALTVNRADGNGGWLLLGDQGSISFLEEAANGTNTVSFVAPAAITSNVNCNLVDGAAMIPDSCVGDGSDDDVPESGDFTNLTGGAGIDNNSGTLDFDATELDALTWGTGAGAFDWTFNTGATDVNLNFGAGGGLALATGSGAASQLILTDQASMVFREEVANGTNRFLFQAPAAVTSNADCIFENDGDFIPDTCVGGGDRASQLNLATGTTSLTPLVVAAGTLNTTAVDGGIEADADTLYAATDAGNRGFIPAYNFIRLDANYTLTSSTTEQKLFNSSTNGRLTLETGTYLFECSFAMTGMSATSGNAAFDILGAGGATLGTVLYQAVGIDNTLTTAASRSGLWSQAAQTGTNFTAAATATQAGTETKGSFEVTVAGTIVPSVTLVTAAAAVVQAGSYCMFNRVGSTSVATIGQWD